MFCLSICIAVPCIALSKKTGKAAAEENKTVLRIWQIDGFEGGKGSRADFLQTIGDDYSKISNCYVSVVSLSAAAARKNLSEGNIPDLISYGAGMYGIEQYINGYKSWCNGCYCILSLDTSTDFSDVNKDNTVINGGKDNFVSAAALISGIDGADIQKPTSAYVNLINGGYKYLFGTQRDVFRLKTRGVSFALKPVTGFNDLYQNISVCANGERALLSQGYVDYLIGRCGEVKKVGMFYGKAKLYDDELKDLEGIEYECKLVSPISEQTKSDIDGIIASGDINKLKNLLK